MNTIDYYFWINSDWAYLGADRLEAIAQRHGTKINYKPVDLLDVYSRTGGIPLPQRSSARQAYRQAELRRWIQRLDIHVNITPKYMCPDAELASRFVIAADTLGHPVAALYKALLHAQWCDEKNIADPAVVLAVGQQLKLPAELIMEHAQLPETLGIYGSNTDAAVELGVFGSPTYVFNNELFWGQDRLDFLDEAIGAVNHSQQQMINS